jgi:hypothetical protein
MNNSKNKLNQKAVSFFVLAIFSLILTFNAFSQSSPAPAQVLIHSHSDVNLPDSLRRVLGSGYDLTGRFAFSPEIKHQILNLDRLLADNRVIPDPNLRTAEFRTVTGTDITEYTRNLTTQTGHTVRGGISVLSFSREASNRFGSERVNRREYEFATRSSVITRDAFFIMDYNLASYINETFINDVNRMTPEQIISRYGTHVMLGALLGARLDYNISVRRRTQTESTAINNLVTASFDARFRGIGGGVSHNRDLENRFGQMFDISSMDTDTRAVGGRPEFAQAVHNDPSPQSYDAWIYSIAGNEVWSGYYPDSLVPLFELIVPERFGARAQALREALRSVIHRHLGEVPLPANFVRVEGGTFQMGTASGGERQ